MPKTSPLRSVALTACALVVAAACSEDEAPPPPLPEGPPDLHIVSFDAPGAHLPISGAGQAGCFPVGESNPKCTDPVSAPGCGFVVVLKTDQNKQIPLELPDGSQPRFWTFQPPLGCGGAPDCGYALLLIEPKSKPCAARPDATVQVIAAGPVISVNYEDPPKGIKGVLGPKTVRVELWPGEGVPDKKHCHFTQVEEVDFELTCGDAGPADGGATDGGLTDSGPTDGASDGSRDAALDAPGPESGPADARSDAPDVSSSDGATDARGPDGNTPDGSIRDASDASFPNDGRADSG
jgi:hypothetical protein